MPLSKTQIEKLAQKKATLIKHDQILDCGFDIVKLKPDNQQKMKNAYHKGTGCKIQMDDEEIKGCGFAMQMGRGFAMKEGKGLKQSVAKIAIDEGVNLLPVPHVAKAVLSETLKHKLVGGSIQPRGTGGSSNILSAEKVANFGSAYVRPQMIRMDN